MILVTSLQLRKPNMPHVMQQHTQIQIAASARSKATLTACRAPAPHTSPHAVLSAVEVTVALPPAAEQPQRLSESRNTIVHFAHRGWERVVCGSGQVLLAVSSSGSSSADFVFPLHAEADNPPP